MTFYPSRLNILILAQCNAIHKTIVELFKHAIVYGQSVKHQPQRVGLTHELADEDISEFWPPFVP
jgi:ribosome-interacting GTPase 1